MGESTPKAILFDLDDTHILAQLKAVPGEAWMVGDDLECDVAGAQRVGMLGIWCDVAGKGLPPGTPVRPDRTIHTLAELLLA